MPSSEVLKHLAVASELHGANLSDAAAQIIVADLAEFPDEDVIAGLALMRRKHEGRFSLAAIVRYIGDAKQTKALKNRPKATCAMCTEAATHGSYCETHYLFQRRIGRISDDA